MFIKRSLINDKIKSITQIIFNKIENNGNANFESNGENFFIDNLMNLLKNRKEEIVIFDIGANIGSYSQMIIDKSDNADIQLHLFEPTKSCFDTLFRKFKSRHGVYLNNIGISNENTIATIYYDKQQSGLASLYQRDLESYHLKLNQSEEIQLKRLDSYIEKNDIKHIHFIKIDIEGHELKAFEGFGKYLNSDFIDYIQFEYGGANLDSHTSLMEIYRFLNSRGFKIAKIMPNGLEIRTYSTYMDNFNYANYVAISTNVIDK